MDKLNIKVHFPLGIQPPEDVFALFNIARRPVVTAKVYKCWVSDVFLLPHMLEDKGIAAIHRNQIDNIHRKLPLIHNFQQIIVVE